MVHRRRVDKLVLGVSLAVAGVVVTAPGEAGATGPPVAGAAGATAVCEAPPAAGTARPEVLSDGRPTAASSLVRRGRVGRRTSTLRRPPISRRPKITTVPCPPPVIPEVPVTVLLTLSTAGILALVAARGRRPNAAVDGR